MGYHINKKHWSKGFASEAAKGCMEFGLYKLGLNKLMNICNQSRISDIIKLFVIYY
ncbi:GNAT family N-acetyltransferase [Bacillus sp. MUM 116]|uniref:GNAT family N-acetyltransferase n=1 Tax=Bacillus sp. MUM 116 TaxID=1678002 RepID=UPI0009F3B94E